MNAWFLAASETVLYPHAAGAPAVGAAPAGWGAGGTSVLLLILGAAGGWMLWRKLRVGGPLARGSHQLAIDETRSLGNRQFLVIASYQDRKFLLGVCPGRIDLLAPLQGEASSPAPGGRFPPLA